MEDTIKRSMSDQVWESNLMMSVSVDNENDELGVNRGKRHESRRRTLYQIYWATESVKLTRLSTGLHRRRMKISAARPPRASWVVELKATTHDVDIDFAMLKSVRENVFLSKTRSISMTEKKDHFSTCDIKSSTHGHTLFTHQADHLWRDSNPQSST